MTVQAHPSFNFGSILWITRHGITIAHRGPSCTWQDDPYVIQEMTVPEGTVCGNLGYPRDVIYVTEAQFRSAVESVGGKYSRTVEAAR